MTTLKTVGAELGDMILDQPRDRYGPFASGPVPEGARRIGVL
jgi:hypothetical protein